MNVASLIIDYVLLCEKRAEMLNFPEFVPLWQEANELAEESLAANTAELKANER